MVLAQPVSMSKLAASSEKDLIFMICRLCTTDENSLGEASEALPIVFEDGEHIPDCHTH